VTLVGRQLAEILAADTAAFDVKQEPKAKSTKKGR
jgi:hypothetical protein